MIVIVQGDWYIAGAIAKLKLSSQALGYPTISPTVIPKC